MLWLQVFAKLELRSLLVCPAFASINVSYSITLELLISDAGIIPANVGDYDAVYLFSPFPPGLNGAIQLIPMDIYTRSILLQ